MRFILTTGLICLLAVVFISEHAEAQSRVGKASVPIVSAKSVPEEEDDDFVPYQGERFNVFDWNLFKAMGSKTSGNLLISPISLKLALVLLYEGAEGQTAHELANALQLPVSRSATRDKFSSILRSLQTASPEYTLNLGTKIFIDSGVLTRQRYAAIVKAFYGTDVVNTNLSDTRSIVDAVNSWVTNITHGNINKAINDGDELKDAVMLVINALFFKGSWRRNTFSPSNTHDGKFYVKTDETIQVPFMSTIGRFYYSESTQLDAQILRIPYQGNKFAMYIVLPRTLNGLEPLIHEINPYTLSRHVWLMQDLPIEVHIPKFKFDFTSHMESTLRELGIRDIFDNTATLTGIARTKRTSRHLLVTDIVQKTGIEVNENGTTAYAVTEVQVGNKIAEDTFIANRPFLFYIEDETTGTVLYVGKVTNPLEKEGCTENVTEEVLPVRSTEEQAPVPPPGKFPKNARHA